MEEILKLIEISKKRGQRSIQLVNQNFRKSEVSKDNLLFEAASNGTLLTDEEAAKIMFNADPGNRNYRNTKGKLKAKLLNHLYFLDYDKETYTSYQKQEYESLHTLHHCKILIEEGAADLAVKRLPQLIKTAREYEFIDIAIEGMEILGREYAKEGKTALYHENIQELKHFRIFRDVVVACEESYYEALAYINKSLSSQNKILSKLPGHIDNLEKRAKEYNSAHLDVLSKKLQLIYNRLTLRFKENINLCSALEKKYLRNPVHEIRVDLDVNDLALTKMVSFFFLRDLKNGQKYAVEQLERLKYGSEEWFTFIEYYFLLELAGEGYKKAEEIYRTVRTNKNFNQLPKEAGDRWQIYRAYLLFMNESKLLKWGFDSNEFVNTIPGYPRHLNGFNIATLIIQFMYLLREGMVNDVKARVNELQKYSSTHLDKRHNYRNSIFIRMLSIVTEKEFNYELIAEKSANYLKKLQKFHIPFDLESELEAIPFEKLWDLILGILRENKLYIHYRFYNPAV